MELQDRTIQCVTCGREFLFTAKEQEFFLSKGFKEPRHCRECRQHRKQERDQAIAQVTGQTYQPGREMFKIVCANCHRESLVPFRPTTGKPVLCKDCFIAQKFGAATEKGKVPSEAVKSTAPISRTGEPEEGKEATTTGAEQLSEKPADTEETQNGDDAAGTHSTDTAKSSADSPDANPGDYRIAAKGRQEE
jgi:CxxC-x17-CxxC domain-containing protein